MRFSEYLRTLDEGNYGHEYGQEAEKHEEALRANREHAAAKRAESTMAPKKPNLQVGANSQEVANRTIPPAEQEKLAGKRKAWRADLRPTGDDGGAQAARDANNTVKEPNGETMLDPKTGKPFPKKGPLKDWQIPSLKEDNRQYDPNVTRENEEDEPAEKTEDDGHAPKKKNTKTAAQLGAEAAAKKVVNDSLEIPMRDPLGRLSIYSMNEVNKPMRKALKKAKMGKKLSNKESGNVMNNPNADGSTRTIAGENYKNPQDDIDAHVDAQASDRENAVGMDRQSHLDK